MPHVYTLEQNYEDIADAIRAKLDVATTYKPSEMAAAIESISSISLPNFRLYRWDSTTSNGYYPPSVIKTGVLQTAASATERTINHNLGTIPRFFFIYRVDFERSGDFSLKSAFMTAYDVDSYSGTDTLESYKYFACRVALRKYFESAVFGTTTGTIIPSSGTDTFFMNITDTSLLLKGGTYSNEDVIITGQAHYWIAMG